MTYTCLIVSHDGASIWTAPFPAASGENAVASAVLKIKTENPLSLRDERPTNKADTEGVPTIINWDYVGSVAAFQVFL